MQNNTTQTQLAQTQLNRGLRLLALDDGGIRGLSELIILEEIMKRLKHTEKADTVPKPCEYFDIIGGVGTGGVIALMLGRLRMPIDVAIAKYVEFSRNVYSDTKLGGREKFKAKTFVSQMKNILMSAGFSENILMLEDQSLCKSFVTALPAIALGGGARIFRSYEVKSNQEYNCTVIEAARATTAIPGFFKAMFIGSENMSEKFYVLL
ncbi:hypothetical protein H0H92_013688 [Tricholoma furcatifolium]|nr:hypothetical protein H0H92_013688 [Tricholoma furcatifolium]